MAETKKIYRKLPGGAASLLGRTRLWYAEDHLLQVNSVAAFESYRRYYFREIRALIVRPTVGGLVRNVIFGVLLVAFLLGGYAFWVARNGREFPVGVTVMGSFAGFFALLLIINLALGKTCRLFVQTKAGVEQLGAPRRLPAARRVREILAPKILTAQAEPSSPIPEAIEEARTGAALS